VVEDENKNYMTAGGLFYVTVGIAFHSVFQELLGKQKQLIGNWKCPKCKDIRKFSFYSRCRSCDVPRVYEELSVSYKKTLIGHVDGLFYDKKTKTYWVIDFKSTSSRQLWFHEKKKDKTLPYKANVSQISAYVPLIEQLYDIKVSGYILAYLPRDNPMKAKLLCIKYMGPKAKARELMRLDSYVKAHRSMLLVKSSKSVASLYENKLCQSRKDYDQNYHEAHHVCPHADICFDRSKMLAYVQTKVKDPIYPIVNHVPASILKELDLKADS
jgi:hypothetical protein